MLFDTDILVWYLRGNQRALEILEQDDIRQVSIISYMELLQCARNKQEIKVIRTLLNDLNVQIIPLTENIGHRASVYMEEYCLKVHMCLADALLAATAVENHLVLCTGNRKHYSPVTEIEINSFRPS